MVLPPFLSLRSSFPHRQSLRNLAPPSPRTEKHGELISIANSYAILNAAYCDAELWFRFGMVVNDTIRQAHIDYAVWDWDARKAVKKYVNTIVDVLPRDTALWIQSDSALWNKVWTAYRTCAVELSELYSLKRFGNITEEDVIVEFGSNKNCRIPMRKSAIAQVEKADDGSSSSSDDSSKKDKK